MSLRTLYTCMALLCIASQQQPAAASQPPRQLHQQQPALLSTSPPAPSASPPPSGSPTEGPKMGMAAALQDANLLNGRPNCIKVPGCPTPKPGEAASPLDRGILSQCTALGGCQKAKEKGLCGAAFMWDVVTGQGGGVRQWCGEVCGCVGNLGA